MLPRIVFCEGSVVSDAETLVKHDARGRGHLPKELPKPPQNLPGPLHDRFRNRSQKKGPYFPPRGAPGHPLGAPGDPNGTPKPSKNTPKRTQDPSHNAPVENTRKNTP